jgi:hypothetical protein
VIARSGLAATVALAAALATGCAATSTRYEPGVVARGELTLRYDHGFEMWGGGKRVARSLQWRGLAPYVRCVPLAEENARRAGASGTTAIAAAVLGGLFAGAGVAVGVVGAAESPHDTAHELEFLGIGVGLAAVGTLWGAVGRAQRNAANGQAVDAMNFYNDAVGSLGATCDDLTYPPPAAEAAPPTPR